MPIATSALSAAVHSACLGSVPWALGKQLASCLLESMDQESFRDAREGGHLFPPASAAVSTCGRGGCVLRSALPGLVSREQNNSKTKTSGEQLPPFRLQL